MTLFLENLLYIFFYFFFILFCFIFFHNFNNVIIWPYVDDLFIHSNKKKDKVSHFSLFKHLDFKNNFILLL